jgi:hypothetical protein
MSNPYYVTVAIARTMVDTEQEATEQAGTEEGMVGVMEAVQPTVEGKHMAAGILEQDTREAPTTIHTSLATIATGKEAMVMDRIMVVEMLAEIAAHAWVQYAAFAAVWTA